MEAAPETLVVRSQGTSATQVAKNDSGGVWAVKVVRNRVPIYGAILGKAEAESLMAALAKDPNETGGTSAQNTSTGKKWHLFDLEGVKRLKDINEHHAICLQTKVQATVGLGFIHEDDKKMRKAKKAAQFALLQQAAGSTLPVSQAEALNSSDDEELSKVDKVLNPLCQINWAYTLNQVCEDFWETGTGYIEVVRRGVTGDATTAITGLHWVPSAQTYMVIEDDIGNYHFEVSNYGDGNGNPVKFARFGDKEAFLNRERGGKNLSEELKRNLSEIIHIPRPNNRSRWYGYPDWLSGVAPMELNQMMLQDRYDYFNNRGVPEFLLFIIGQKMGDTDWKKIEDSVQATIGGGNAHKSAAINISNPEVKVQLEKLALETKDGSGFGADSEACALRVVSAHGVPPLLAGIQIPGKLGATNELPNALMAFQTIKIGPAQRLFQQVLGHTLGGDKAGLGLTMVDFTFKTILEEIDVEKMDTVARMRQTPMQAGAEGRDTGKGVKKEGE